MTCKRYKRAEYAGNTFRTEYSQDFIKTNDSVLRYDYNDSSHARAVSMATQYGIIKKIFQHEPCSVYEGRVIVQVEWLVNVSKCPLTFIQTVRRNSLNPDMEFIFLDSCYQQGLWLCGHTTL